VDGDAGKWQCDTITSGDSVGTYASLDLNASDKPYIAHYDGTDGDLHMASYSGLLGNCGPGLKWWCESIDASPSTDTGKYASLAVDKEGAGTRQIAYHDATNEKLKYASYVGQGGNCGRDIISLEFKWQCDEIVTTGTGTGPWGISLALDGAGQPLIAFQDASDSMAPPALKTARPIAALGIITGNCGPKVGLVSLWQCDTIDGGGSHTDEANYAAVAVNSAGLAAIAYHESDSKSGGGRLKVAYQEHSYQVFLPIVVR
jgi:hypothetical protein